MLPAQWTVILRDAAYREIGRRTLRGYRYDAEAFAAASGSDSAELYRDGIPVGSVYPRNGLRKATVFRAVPTQDDIDHTHTCAARMMALLYSHEQHDD